MKGRDATPSVSATATPMLSYGRFRRERGMGQINLRSCPRSTSEKSPSRSIIQNITAPVIAALSLNVLCFRLSRMGALALLSPSHGNPNAAVVGSVLDMPTRRQVIEREFVFQDIPDGDDVPDERPNGLVAYL